jgi:hypothetical protein
MLARIADIRVGERRREDLGDIAGLAESLKKYGLLHPIIVDEDLTLIAGQRRLEAAKLLGWTEIDVRYKTDLSEKEKREIELEENLRRKDLTPYERSKVMMQLAEAAAEVLAARAQSEVLVESAKTSKGGRPPKKAAPEQQIAERIGVPRETVNKAERHVATANTYPVMQSPDWKQYHVLEAKEALEKLPEEERPVVVAMVGEPGIPPKLAIELIRNVGDMKPDERKEICQLYQSNDPRDRSLAKTKAAQLPPEPDPRLFPISDAIQALQKCVRQFPNDPLTPRFKAVIQELEELKKEVREASKRE